MANVGWVGLGKLGAPCAAALQHYGEHVVHGYDLRGTDPGDYSWSDLKPVELVESIGDVVKLTDEVVYVAVQTPHAPLYGGDRVTPEQLLDFEYAYLVNAVREVCLAARTQRKHVTIAVVSTVLPGTFSRYLRQLADEYATFVYHPFFIAMGTEVDDFVRPEMVIYGTDRDGDHGVVDELYSRVHDAPVASMSIDSAELAKVAYNTFITVKIVFANSLMELCEGTGADVDEVTDALVMGTQRITSGRYMRAGMGDGGGCHPRDNIALATLGERLGVSTALNDFLIRAREAQTSWIADFAVRWTQQTDMSAVVLGLTYKPDVPLTDGSPALLLVSLLEERGVGVNVYDPLLNREESLQHFLDRFGPRVYVIGTEHAQLLRQAYPAGSVVIDPFGTVTRFPGVTYVTPGRKG
jgi:UDPglucose 6-dehydrogenase